MAISPRRSPGYSTGRIIKNSKYSQGIDLHAPARRSRALNGHTLTQDLAGTSDVCHCYLFDPSGCPSYFVASATSARLPARHPSYITSLITQRSTSIPTTTPHTFPLIPTPCLSLPPPRPFPLFPPPLPGASQYQFGAIQRPFSPAASL
jgi:hypothetical protein